MSRIRQGIEYNRYGRPMAYHFSSLDERDAYYYTINGRGYVRVPADEVIHVFRKDMVGQRRGIPWAATALYRLHHLQGFEDAAVQNARASASKMGFIEWESRCVYARSRSLFGVDGGVGAAGVFG